MKYIIYSTILLLCALEFSSCVKENNYSIIPNITYKSFTPFCSGATTDSAYLQVNFTDGDGDIGYDAQDASAPFDFYVIELVNDNGNYVPIVMGSDTAEYAYHIPDITPDGKNKSLNGIIQINLEGFLNEFTSLSIPGYNFYEVEFEVWIFDRAGHKSNVITTPPLTLCQ